MPMSFGGAIVCWVSNPLRVIEGVTDGIMNSPRKHKSRQAKLDNRNKCSKRGRQLKVNWREKSYSSLCGWLLAFKRDEIKKENMV